MASGPLKGVRVLEFAGIGPGPFTCMLLSDMGADVVRVDRKDGFATKFDCTARGRRSVALNLKDPAAIEACLAMIGSADVLVEGFRPGVMERLGLGPETALKANPKLVYGRMTGWGQTGPLAQAAGHDLNYIALTGALYAMGKNGEPPLPPLNLVGDFGGGALYLAMGICAALFEAQRSGKGQVIDCAMTDGAASLTTMFHGLRNSGFWRDERQSNALDGGAPYYGAYACKDGHFVSVGSMEPKFYALLLEKTGLSADPLFQKQNDHAKWPEARERLAEVMRTKTRDEWRALMEGGDVCFAPVLSWTEAYEHPHNKARETFVTIDGITQPNVAPRFSETPSEIQGPPAALGEHTRQAMQDWGLPQSLIDRAAG